uniref:Survival Motor Neuron Gemin2-binding domain-containing protein n=1 Tax=Opuntia streptacantha TaxID=393608 RepID=A0A7C8ZVA4_OPUST
MGKEGELWDDSALIKAFDDAISKYKKMHGKGFKEESNGVNGDMKSSTDDASPANDANELDYSHLETENEGRKDASHGSVEVAETEVNDKGDKVAASQVPTEQVLGSSNLPIQDEAQGISSSVAVDEYNQLYQQYYELEEQRQKILQKLQNFNSWDYTGGVEASGSGVQWGNTVTQECQSSISQLPCGTMVVSCCPCACPCSVASCSSLPCPSPVACTSNLCDAAPASIDLQKQLAVEDADIVKMAMGAAERAISTLKDTTPAQKGDNKICSGPSTNASPETDLSTVLNAWYSAGFYTGKFLTEQSVAKKQDS